jgi:hypothetical protein
LNMKTVTGLFDNHEDASIAVSELRSMGVPDADISIVANNAAGWHKGEQIEDDTSNAAEGAASGAGLGAVVGGAGGLLAGLGIMAIPGLGPVVAAGWLAATAVGALGGAVVGGAAGGIVGALTEAGVPEADAHVYAEGVRRGGSLVTARVSDELATEAQGILADANSVDVETRRASYKEGGWSEFDPDADDYVPQGLSDDTTRTVNRL